MQNDECRMQRDMSSKPAGIILKGLREARIGGLITSGDLVLFRGRGLISRLIRACGRSPYSHAGMICFWSASPFLCEIREWHGGRAVTLASQVRKYGGRMDVFRVNRELFSQFSGTLAGTEMSRLAGDEYNYRGVLLAGLRRLPFLRLCFSHRTCDDQFPAHRGPLFCSEAVAQAARVGGGVDPVPLLADRLTEPGDLARSSLWKYAFTLNAE